ncbi:Deoxyuridine 5'-triphosphate nucleotidohydrolase [Glycine soja]|uniref:dUTP diphosphatase n=1 Tax=Glycine soja TaxID=3848 RepID=A0A445GGH0_GLYSO|nr:Deoxyuridine 5'-triphosphate nucleotidohydrolase [Glycine soja]
MTWGNSNLQSLPLPSFFPSRGLTLNLPVLFCFSAPRSGLAWKHSIDVGAGVIDADCRGPIVMPEVVEVQDLDSTLRAEGGFGSTGV